jgi:hypothetical protein
MKRFLIYGIVACCGLGFVIGCNDTTTKKTETKKTTPDGKTVTEETKTEKTEDK